MMQADAVEVRTDSIRHPIMETTRVSLADVARLASSSCRLPLIRLARIRQGLYPIGGFASLEAARRRGDDSVICTVRKFATKRAALREGLLDASIAEPIDPIRVPGIMEYLGGGAGFADSIGMSGTWVEKVARANLAPEVFGLFDDLLDLLSARLPAHMLVVPPFMLTALAKIGAERQAAAAREMISLVPVHDGEMQFAWPTPAQAAMAARGADRPQPCRPAVPIRVDGEEPQEPRQATTEVLKTLKNCMVVERPDETLVINLQTGRASKIDDAKDGHLLVEEDVAAGAAPIMPHGSVRHLDWTEKKRNVKNCNSPARAIAYLARVPKGARVSVFWTL